ncbi:ComF family protein [Simkania negevensis]|uniref:ComF family protein n=1 Tax=Simkania negevensis TaxID=83561 RepID=A0ABS3ATQ3_9BACT|nr:ComF family protein [Simkania negevensis]
MSRKHRLCFSCQKERRRSFLAAVASALDYEGPARTLVTELKYGKKQYLAPAIASYMQAHFAALDWPKPDVVVPVPISFSHWLSRRFNQSALLAQELANALDVPCKQVLLRKSGSYAQAGLSVKQRRGLDSTSFYVWQGASVEDEIVLLVDDVFTTGTTLACCAEALLDSCPQAIFGYTACRAQ